MRVIESMYTYEESDIKQNFTCLSNENVTFLSFLISPESCYFFVYICCKYVKKFYWILNECLSLFPFPTTLLRDFSRLKLLSFDAFSSTHTQRF